MFHKVARKELGYTIIQILIAPFGEVRFRDFFFADVLTSIGKPLGDMGFVFVHLVPHMNDDGNWHWLWGKINKDKFPSL
jgi:hypothetical protein